MVLLSAAPIPTHRRERALHEIESAGAARSIRDYENRNSAKDGVGDTIEDLDVDECSHRLSQGVKQPLRWARLRSPQQEGLPPPDGRPSAHPGRRYCNDQLGHDNAGDINGAGVFAWPFDSISPSSGSMAALGK